jgi:hypothetical protein
MKGPMKVIVIKTKVKVKKKKDKPEKPDKPDKPPKKEAVSVGILIGPVEEQTPMSVPIKETQQVTLTANPLNAKGNPAPVDGVPEWQIDNPALGTITPAADGMTALFKASGGPGTVIAKVIADADMGAGVRSIEGTIEIIISAVVLEAVSIGITAGTPEEQP